MRIVEDSLGDAKILGFLVPGKIIVINPLESHSKVNILLDI